MRNTERDYAAREYQNQDENNEKPNGENIRRLDRHITVDRQEKHKRRERGDIWNCRVPENVGVRSTFGLIGIHCAPIHLIFRSWAGSGTAVLRLQCPSASY